jgi:hypothetical protein
MSALTRCSASAPQSRQHQRHDDTRAGGERIHHEVADPPSRCIELRQLDRGREQREAGHVLCRPVRIAKFDRKTGKREDGKVLGNVRQERHRAQRRHQRQHADRRKAEPRANLEHTRHIYENFIAREVFRNSAEFPASRERLGHALPFGLRVIRGSKQGKTCRQQT